MLQHTRTLSRSYLLPFCLQRLISKNFDEHLRLQRISDNSLKTITFEYQSLCRFKTSCDDFRSRLFHFLLKYTIYNIRLSRNVKCDCDDCCELKIFGKALPGGRKAGGGHNGYKKSSDWKQTRCRIKRANAASSFSNGCVHSVVKQRTQTLILSESSQNIPSMSFPPVDGFAGRTKPQHDSI